MAMRRMNSAFWEASACGNYTKVLKLLQQRRRRHGRSAWDVNARDEAGMTALFAACIRNHGSVVHLLLSKGVDPTVGTHDGFTPLIAAASYGYTAVVLDLLHHPSVVTSVDARHPNTGITALYFACYKGHSGVVSVLLAHNADPVIVDPRGISPIRVAAFKGHRACMQVLQCWLGRRRACGHSQVCVDILKVRTHRILVVHQGTRRLVAEALYDTSEECIADVLVRSLFVPHGVPQFLLWDKYFTDSTLCTVWERACKLSY